jgi:hypothetical protein
VPLVGAVAPEVPQIDGGALSSERNGDLKMAVFVAVVGEGALGQRPWASDIKGDPFRTLFRTDPPRGLVAPEVPQIRPAFGVVCAWQRDDGLQMSLAAVAVVALDKAVEDPTQRR